MITLALQFLQLSSISLSVMSSGYSVLPNFFLSTCSRLTEPRLVVPPGAPAAPQLPVRPAGPDRCRSAVGKQEPGLSTAALRPLVSAGRLTGTLLSPCSEWRSPSTCSNSCCCCCSSRCTADCLALKKKQMLVLDVVPEDEISCLFLEHLSHRYVWSCTC